MKQKETFSYDELQRAALAYILEDDIWPVFLSWAVTCNASDGMIAWLKTASLDQTRREWIRHSPDPRIAAIADEL